MRSKAKDLFVVVCREVFANWERGSDQIFKFIGINFPNKHCAITHNLLTQIGKYRLLLLWSRNTSSNSNNIDCMLPWLIVPQIISDNMLWCLLRSLISMLILIKSPLQKNLGNYKTRIYLWFNYTSQSSQFTWIIIYTRNWNCMIP